MNVPLKKEWLVDCLEKAGLPSDPREVLGRPFCFYSVSEGGGDFIHGGVIKGFELSDDDPAEEFSLTLEITGGIGLSGLTFEKERWKLGLVTSVEREERAIDWVDGELELL